MNSLIVSRNGVISANVRHDVDFVGIFVNI